MMGRRERGQGQFFYAFDLDEVVPPDHLVRQIDGVLDLDWVHEELAPYYSHTGRPSIDPVLMIRMLIVGYVFAIRSERQLCSEVQVNLAYRWFCKLGIEDRIPDHSVFSRARHERFRQSDALRRVFEGVVAKCIAAGLVGGEGFSIDASLIKADVDKKKRLPGNQPIAWPKPEEAPRAVREYLAALDAARDDNENGNDDDGLSGGGNRRKPPKEVSLTDPQAAWVARKNSDPFFAYDANYLIDNKVGIIVDAEGTRANRRAEIAIAGTMIERVNERFDLRPQRLAGDTAYGAVRMLKWLVDRQILPHIPVWDKSTRTDGTFSRADFVFDQSRNVYICPGGKLLHTTGTLIEGSALRYRASKRDCDICTLKMQCCPHTPMRQVPRDLHEDARDVARSLAKTEAFERSRRERKKVEVRFAHMKRILRLDRLRLRGLSGAKDEVLLTATAQNLRRLVKSLCRPPPSPAVTCAA
ncbi:MAG TPA: IS1182 family transposase [Candidatus Binatia bacterium]|jgi:transposase|nr:IS1182 family transposase [Candidatus Binatia bacterium]